MVHLIRGFELTERLVVIGSSESRLRLELYTLSSIAPDSGTVTVFVASFEALAAISPNPKLV